ncbi:IS1634 family transposase (plasmid) [Acidiphilium multivorum]|uniref:IS1634 family transposase n=1 Tax=Acidiphilium multivorum TaxID=62140 RepID=UPI001F4BE830|nr:IS1634 family transposase [Acidiphilium multivorum]UNC16553.1 IS1634 family transposase [Acidiphilium multivorum]
MFVVERVARGHSYLYLVESVRVGKSVRQRTIKPLGRKDILAASGELDRLVAAIARHAERSIILSDIDAGRIAAHRIGGPLLFGRLWDRLGIGEVLNNLLEGRQFGFAVERAVFVATLHRLFVSGSDRSCVDWMQSYAIDGAEDLALHHFYRAMAWLGEELGDRQAGAIAPRCVKDVIEEQLFERRRDLFTDLSLVFMDTTSLSFYGEGGETLGRRGHSKDYRPDLAQMILALVIDAEGRPICTEMVPGNTADVKILMPVVTRLRERFGITRACVVADRGMISADTIAALEALGMEYILGARERTSRVIRDVVLKDKAAMVPLVLDRQHGETQLWVKEVRIGKGKAAQRYIVTVNEAEAEKDREDRQAIIDGLQAQLKKGDKALVGNSAYRRYLRSRGNAFEIDPGKLAEEARFDGLSVLRTNARVTPLQAVIRYRDLLEVEALFRAAKASFDTRPIFHQADAAIRGHVFCSFLALTLAKELNRLCGARGFQPEWQKLLNDLDRLQQATIEKGGKVITTRTHVTGQVGNVFKAAGIALPHNISEHPAD